MAESMHHPMQPPRIQTQGLQMHNHPVPEYATMDDFNRAYQQPHQMMHPIIPSNMPEYAHSPYEMMSPQSAQAPPHSFRMPHAESPMPSYIATSPVSGSPGWLSLPSPSATIYPNNAHPPSSQQLRYPVLAPLVPHLTNIMPVSLACDLLELYFQSSSTAFMQPTSPYVLCYVFRKESFLRHNNPRLCSPALLASMLWIGCLTSESPYLASSPSARSQLSEKLINLTISLLKPLVHQSQGDDVSPTFSSGATMNNFGIATQDPEMSLPGEGIWQRSYAASSAGAPGGIDDVCTYANLAVVISASEYKAASLRWWNAAWSLARELKLSKEVPLTPPPEEAPESQSELDGEHIGGPSGQNIPLNLTEEQREERRRVWWMLYTVDRHLALCYNRPLSLLDIECSDLQTPVSDDVWQSPALFGNSAQSFSDPSFRRSTGPIYECTGTSTFGFFLPLMSILGEIVEVHHARNHPRFGSKTNWDDHATEITRQLEAYGHSLRELKARAITEANAEAQEPILPGTPSVRSVNSTTTRAQESLMRARIVVAYGTHIMHTLHILLNGKWDPISLLDDNDLWISSQSFIDATGHAVAAAEALNEILELDPDLSFMPFFFGIYLLQGSFLLLLIADKLQGEANPNVVKACETIVRAHEACIVTLNTEYQVRLPQPLTPTYPLKRPHPGFRTRTSQLCKRTQLPVWDGTCALPAFSLVSSHHIPLPSLPSHGVATESHTAKSRKITIVMLTKRCREISGRSCAQPCSRCVVAAWTKRLSLRNCAAAKCSACTGGVATGRVLRCEVGSTTRRIFFLFLLSLGYRLHPYHRVFLLFAFGYRCITYPAYTCLILTFSFSPFLVRNLSPHDPLAI